jgi:predicted DNA-binding transcriptional regulator YafY
MESNGYIFYASPKHHLKKTMDQTGRLYRIDQLLRQHKVISFAVLQSELKVSRATLKRDISDLRTRLLLPIEWSRAAGGYRLAAPPVDASRGVHELPGLWFSSTEVHALLVLRHLLDCLDTGGLIINPVPVADRLHALLHSQDAQLQELRRRVRIIGMEQEVATPRYFERVGLALVRRKRLALTTLQGANSVLVPDASPLRLVFFKGEWILEALCHPQDVLQGFALNAITDARELPRPAVEVPAARLDAHFGPAYGQFSTGRVRWAKLLFTAERANTVANVVWHPLQQGKLQNDGTYLLRVPYLDPRELLADILQQGAHCEVLGPTSLRQAMADEVGKMLQIYQAPAPLDEDDVHALDEI